MIPAAKRRASGPVTPTAVIERRLEDARFRTELRQLIIRIIVIGAAAWLLFSEVFLITQVRGQNMFPAVKDGDLVIAFRLQRKYMKGDIVVCTVYGQRYIGRIAANQNDNIDLTGEGGVTVNGTVQGGEIIYPTYAHDGVSYPFHVPDGNVFLMGDYRTFATDSRDFGPVPYKQVQGKVITVLRRREL